MKKFTKPPAWRGLFYYIRCFIRRRPNWVNIEVTKRCNAKCNFCGYWEEKNPPELADYTDIVKEFRPVVLSLSGGEPLIRKDLADIVRKARPYCHYVAMVTNGILLTKERAAELFDAGLNQLSISLDFLDETHDQMRGVPGLFKKISTIAPELAREGYNVVFNTIIMDTNIDHIIPLVKKAKEWGVAVSFSTYCHMKKDNKTHMIANDESYIKLTRIIKELKQMKRDLGNIKNSDYYLDRVPQFVAQGAIPDCKAGTRWVQVTPDGFLQPCSELPRFCSAMEYSRDKVPMITCDKCWFACRGEAEANFFDPRRLIELIRS